MTPSRILIHHIHFRLSHGKTLFNDLTLALSQRKIGLIGKNGVGKSTLLKLILGELSPSAGLIHVEGKLGFVPQNPFFLEGTTIADFLECKEKIHALHRITAGSVDEKDFVILNEAWDIEEQLKQWLNMFELSYIPYNREITRLSGGEITKLCLVKAFLSQADFLLLDEPTNHLDSTTRQQLYTAIQQWQRGLLIVSHDRALLNHMNEIIELTSLGTNSYGGNYDNYEAQKTLEAAARDKQLNDAKKCIQKTKNTIQASRERHEQKQSYGKARRRSGKIDKMGADSKKGRSEKTQNKLLIQAEQLIHHAEAQLQAAQEKVEILETLAIELPATDVPNGKLILDIEDLNFSYAADKKIIQDFSLKIQGPQRIAFAGDNGSGKTTLVKLILHQLQPLSGKISLGTSYVRYLDQHSSLLYPDLSILENFLQFNPEAKVNDAYRALAQFLFKNITALKTVKELSGGEKLRALLACVLMSNQPPQLLILDEPTNHLDLTSLHSIESALNHYQGALIVISHDTTFLEHIGIEKIISAPFIHTDYPPRYNSSP